MRRYLWGGRMAGKSWTLRMALWVSSPTLRPSYLAAIQEPQPKRPPFKRSRLASAIISTMKP